MIKRSIKPILSLLFITTFLLFNMTFISAEDELLTQDNVKLTLSTAQVVSSGQGKTIDDIYTVSEDSVFTQTYSIKNSSAYTGSIEIAIYERITTSNGSIIEDKTLNATVNQNSTAKVTGTSVTMKSTYGKYITIACKLMYKLDNEWIEYSSSSSTIELYSPQFTVTYTTDADPVGISDFPVFFGGKVILSSGVRANDIKIYDSVYGLLEKIGDLKEGQSKRFHKDISVPAGSINSYVILEYTNAMTGENVRSELPTVKVTGKVIDSPIESKLTLDITPAKTYIETAEKMDITFDFQNNTDYEVITAFIYLLDDQGKASEEPIIDIGAVEPGAANSSTENMTIEPDEQYSFAIYAYVADSSTPFKATTDLTISSVPPSLEIQRSIDTDKLPFYTDTTISYSAKNVSGYELTDVVITDGILGEIYTAESIATGEEFTFAATGKFTNDFISAPSASLTIQDGKNTANSFILSKQIFEIERKNEPSAMLLIENIDSKDKENVSFDVILLNDGNANLSNIEIIDARNSALLETLDSLIIGDKQTIQLSDQNYADDKNITLKVKCTTDDGTQLEFSYDPVSLSTFPLTAVIIIGAVFIVLAVCIIIIKSRQKNK